MLIFRVVRMLRALGTKWLQGGGRCRLVLMREEQGKSPGWSFTKGDKAVGKRCGGIWVLHILGGGGRSHARYTPRD